MDRLVVILVAQVFNGCLLPFFSICLLLCINDEQFMGRCPQKGWHNVFLVIGVTITLLLASNVIVQKVKKQSLNTVNDLNSGVVKRAGGGLAQDLVGAGDGPHRHHHPRTHDHPRGQPTQVSASA